jgi:hypothetical protein
MAESPASQPRAGVDYPRNLIEFGEFFPDEKACVPGIGTSGRCATRSPSARRRPPYARGPGGRLTETVGFWPARRQSNFSLDTAPGRPFRLNRNLTYS